MQENGYLSPQIFTANHPLSGIQERREKGNEAKASNSVRLNGNIAHRRPCDEMTEY